VSKPILSDQLLGGRVLELAREVHGRAWRLTVRQTDGKDRRQVGGFDLTLGGALLVDTSLAPSRVNVSSRQSSPPDENGVG
jgi:hypothetical protein